MSGPPRLMPAIVTPFTDDGALDLAAHAHNVGLLTDAGIAGFVIGGSTGEGPYLEPGDRADLARATRDTAPGAFVLVGIVAESLRTARDLAQEIEAAGADAVLVMTPTTLVRHLPELVVGHYEALAGEVGLPVYLYSVPRVTAYDLALEAAAELALHPNVAGIKDSSGDLGRARALAVAPFVVFVGATGIVADAMAAGVHGAITASTNYAAGLALDVVRSAASGGGAGGPQETLTTVSKAVERHGVPGVKYAATRVGLLGGALRLPLRPPSDEARQEIDAALEMAGLV